MSNLPSIPWTNRERAEIRRRLLALEAGGGGGGGVSDGDKGDITVSGTGATWTIDAGAVSLPKMANLATSTIVGRATSGTGVPEALTAAQVRTILNVADGAQVNVATDLAYTAATRVLASSTGTDATLPLVVAAGDAGLMSGADKTKLDGIASGAQVNVATDLSYTAATRVLASSTGADATLPLVTSGDPGLAPASGGGTTNFLRADLTWAAPPGGGGGGSSPATAWVI